MIALVSGFNFLQRSTSVVASTPRPGKDMTSPFELPYFALAWLDECQALCLKMWPEQPGPFACVIAIQLSMCGIWSCTNGEDDQSQRGHSEGESTARTDSRPSPNLTDSEDSLELPTQTTVSAAPTEDNLQIFVRQDRELRLSQLRDIYSDVDSVGVVLVGEAFTRVAETGEFVSDVKLEVLMEWKGTIPETYVAQGGTIGDTTIAVTDAPSIKARTPTLAFFNHLESGWILRAVARQTDENVFYYLGHYFGREELTAIGPIEPVDPSRPNSSSQAAPPR